MERKIPLLRQETEEQDSSRIYRATHRELLGNGTALLVVRASALAQAQYFFNCMAGTAFTLRIGYRLFHFGQLIEEKKGEAFFETMPWETKSVPLLDPLSFDEQEIRFSFEGFGQALEGLPPHLKQDRLAYERALRKAKGVEIPVPENRKIFLPRWMTVSFEGGT